MKIGTFKGGSVTDHCLLWSGSLGLPHESRSPCLPLSVPFAPRHRPAELSAGDRRGERDGLQRGQRGRVEALGLLTIATLVLGATHVRSDAAEHEGRYQKNLTYKGPLTGDEIIYTLYLPPEHSEDKGPYPLIVFLHGAGGGNASSVCLSSTTHAENAVTLFAGPKNAASQVNA